MQVCNYIPYWQISVILGRNKKIIGPIPISDEGSGREE